MEACHPEKKRNGTGAGCKIIIISFANASLNNHDILQSTVNVTRNVTVFVFRERLRLVLFPIQRRRMKCLHMKFHKRQLSRYLKPKYMRCPHCEVFG